MCLVDRAVHESLILHIRLQFTKPSQPAQNISGAFVGNLKARVSGMTRHAGVIDACKVGDGVVSRILLLNRSSDGVGELSLQAPWSSVLTIGLPSKLFVHNPYQIANDLSLCQRREGGFKRVLSQGPRALTALRHGNSQGCVDVVDSDGVKHRLQIGFRPQNPLLRKVIRVAESVLPSSEVDGEAILRGWWDATGWLQTRPEEEIDAEWTAMLVVLFSMAVPFMGEHRAETTTRQKRRKGGLLRSSSGANTDLESWEAMLTQEGGSSSTSPAWTQENAWAWTLKEKVTTYASPSQRSKLMASSLPPTAVAIPISKKSPYILHCISLARDFVKSPIGQAANGKHGYFPTASAKDPVLRRTALASILVALHLLREDSKLDILTAEALHHLTPVLAQIGTWLGWEAWNCNESSYYMLESTNMEYWLFEDAIITGMGVPPQPFAPPSILQYIETANTKVNPPMITLRDMASSPEVNSARGDPTEASTRLLLDLTPRTIIITNLLNSSIDDTMEGRIAKMSSWGLSLSILETVPESIAASFRTSIAVGQAQPSTKWDSRILKMIGREDIAILERERRALRTNGRPR